MCVESVYRMAFSLVEFSLELFTNSLAVLGHRWLTGLIAASSVCTENLSLKFRLWNSNIFNRDSRLKHLNCFEDIYPSTSKLVRDTIKKLFTFRQMKHFKSVKNPIILNLIVLLIQWPSLINQIPNIKTFKSRGLELSSTVGFDDEFADNFLGI